MAIGVTLVIVVFLIIAIWVIVEFKRFRHKFFAILLILLIIFTYFSFVVALKGKDIDFGSVDGLKKAGKLYFAWLGSAFSNLKLITSNAVRMNWTPNSTDISTDIEPQEDSEGNSE